MTEPVTATAPGKLVVLGEYAVLEGAPAVVFAVDRQARVTVTPHEPGAADLVTQVQPAAVSLTARRAPPAPDSAAAPPALLDAVLRAARDHGVWPDCDAIDLHTDTSAFFRDATKLGFGSSAAVAVATWEALWQSAKNTPAPRDAATFAILLAAHRDFQGGRGSGVDIAASLHGGAIVCRRHGEALEVVPLTLPAGLSFQVVWTGAASSTGKLLARLADLRACDSARWDRAHEGLISAAVSGVARIGTGSAGDWLEAVADYAGALQVFATRTGLPIWAGGHDRLQALAAAAGVACKPSGAGGGDIAIALSDEPERLRAFSASAARAGFAPIEARLAPARAPAGT